MCATYWPSVLSACWKASNEVLEIGEPVRGEDDLSVDSNPCVENIQAGGSNGCKHSFDREEDRYMLDMMTFGSAESKRVLDRIVGSVSKTFWKVNHVSADGTMEDYEEAAHEDEDMPDLDGLGTVHPATIELDM